MQKLLLLSVVVALVAIPAVAARDPSPRRGLKKVLLSLFLFDAAYVLGLRYIYPLLVPPEVLGLP